MRSLGNLGRGSAARRHDIDDLWVLGDIRRADTSKIGKGRIDFLLGSAPRVNAGRHLLGELGRGAEAGGITVGIALRD
jgi:hypothetical protein